MDKATVLGIVSKFQKALESEGIRVSKIILFGSYAKETFREGSDIDLIVISEDFIGKGYWERIEVLSEAIYKVFKPIEAVAMTPEEWINGQSPLVDYAADGEVVYTD